MKKFVITLILLVVFGLSTTLSAQNQSKEYLGLPGDNLNLYAVMKLFQESETLEIFEKSLNDPNSHINNLDLNGDNRVDYIRVLDNVDGDVHNIVLQVPVNSNESQDVAVFTVQRFQNGKVFIQLIGDEALYGKDYILEPDYSDDDSGQTPNPGYSGNNNSYGNNTTYTRVTTIEVGAWPLVRFIYMPNYILWHSSWRYGYYPSYWRPWRPYYWDYYYGYHYNWYNDYYGHYRRSHYHRYERWNDFYYVGHRSYSRNVDVRIREGRYSSTYSKPDQFKKGETLFIKSHPDKPTRRDVPASSNSNVRRPDNQRAPERKNTGTVTNRRQETQQVPERKSEGTVINRRQETQQVPVRKNESTVTNRRQETQQVPERKNEGTVTNRRQVNTVIRQSEERPAATPVRVESQRSNERVINRSESKGTEPKAATPRQPRESSSGNATAPQRRSTEKATKSTPVKETEKKKEAETTTSSRRK